MTNACCCFYDITSLLPATTHPRNVLIQVKVGVLTEFDQGKVHKNADREFLGFFSSGNWKSSYLSNNTGPLSPRTASSPNWDYLYILLQKAYFDESNWWLLHMFTMFSQWHTRTWLQERFHILEGGLFSKVAMWELLVVNMWQSRWCWCIVPPPLLYTFAPPQIEK